jgi:hypothetical protein
MISWWLAIALGQTCETVDGLVDRMRDAVLEADFAGANELRDRAEAGLRCGEPVTPEVLGRYWVVSGVLAWLDGDHDGARRRLDAGMALAPGAWDPLYGEELTGVWSALEDPVGEGTLVVSPALGEGWSLVVDGAPASTPLVVRPGLHVVQVHAHGGVALGEIVLVPAGDTVRVSHTLPAVAPQPAVVAPPVAPGPAPSPAAVGASLVLGVGVDVAAGQRLTDADRAEPAGKVHVPVELGVVVEGGGLWFRSVAALGPMLGGSYLFANEQGEASSPVAVGGHVAAGPRLGDVRVGVSAGVQWPSRIPLRAVVSVPLGDSPLRVEARAGVNIATGDRVEGAGTVHLAFVPWL